MAIGLKDERIDGVDQRLVESYAVPAAMMAAVMGMNQASAAGILRTMLSEAKSDMQIDLDEMNLISDMLSSNVRGKAGNNKNVAQVLNLILDKTKLQSERDDWSEALESVGIRIFYTVGPPKLLIQYKTVRDKLFRGTRWEGQPLDQYLKRVPGNEYTRQRVGGVCLACIAFDLDFFIRQYVDSELAQEVNLAEQPVDTF